MIDIKNADKAEVLRRLYNHAKSARVAPHPLIRAMHDQIPEMTLEQAQDIIANSRPYFDYLGPKILKVDLTGDTFEEGLYDRDNGEGLARKALEGVAGVVFEDDEPTKLGLFPDED